MTTTVKSLLPSIKPDGFLEDIQDAICKLSRKKQEKLVKLLIDDLDGTRLDCAGGYPSNWTILDTVKGPMLVRATMDAGKDYNAPELEVEPLVDYLCDHLVWIDEMLTAEDEAKDGRSDG